VSATSASRPASPEAKDAASPAEPAASIRLRPWSPGSPYAARMREASAGQVYRVYLDERPDYLRSSAFFLDAADILFERGEPELAVRVLSNLAEMDLENRHLLRILGYRLLQAGRAPLAIPVFREVLALSPEEPQSYRDLGLAYDAAKQPQKAIDLLYEVVSRPWHGRFPEVELIALAELNAIVALSSSRLDVSRIDPRLLKNLPLDIRAELTWDADNTDIDLWVTDPNGERAYYGHRLTYQGGRMSADFTGGYGPEEFSLKTAKPGRYQIHANFYGHRQQIVAGATTLQVKLTTGFGTPRAEERIITLRLKGASEVVHVGDFEIR
jgi:tetratricopeptide (TPR) repeat protein